MKIEYHQYQLQLKDTFRISHASRDVQPSLVVSVSHNGFTGFGEAAATSYYGVTVEGMIESLKKVENIVENHIEEPPEVIWEKLYPELRTETFALCALDMALHDLYGKRKQKPLYKLWNLDPSEAPQTSYTIGIASTEEMIRKIKDFPWPLYKIKLGTDHDIEIIKELRKHTNSVFRIDANVAWNAKQAIENSHILKELNVEFLEQPLPVDDLDGQKILYEKSGLPVIADESCIVESDVEKCTDRFHGVNIKLTKCGGITPALRMIAKAKSLGLKTMVGCMTESTVGISAIAQLAPMLDFVDMDGALLLKNDTSTGVKITSEKVIYPTENGTGVKLFKFE
ncbi:dipeptide epimerase [Zunongwangia atlantica]|uniref:Dipeptide epimerase n=1 Tax=Zunongwangia atlantica 22II14-10F7 TaxID=1185767 RepID=A0A1Y1T2K8_9FLAO|nr:dipeptide epimerase [Zunongwangia atlantica]ORL45251.1 mandelate racemase/muconate lactonizing enzyme family protein [Zunongwangia atlantica 22II14-10F7]